MKISRTLVTIALLFLFLSLAVTLASYNFSYIEPNTVDATFVYRGWPLYWMIESWSYWSPPPYPHTFDFQLLNFLVDLVFWLVVFTVPSATLLLFKKKSRKNE